MYALAVPVLLVLELAVAAERWAHEAPAARRARAFLASDAAGFLSLVALLAPAGVGSLAVVR